MEGRTYLQDGQLYDRVTSILDWVGQEEGLIQWQGKVGNREANKVRRNALRRGTSVHALIQDTLQGGVPEEPSDYHVSQAYKAWERWQALNPILEMRGIERTLYDNGLLIAGTPDLWTVEELYDWKIGKRITWKYIWQAHAYLELIFRATGLRLTKYRIVRLDPDIGEFEEFLGIYDPRCWEAFEGLTRSYKYWRLTHLVNEEGKEDADAADTASASN